MKQKLLMHYFLKALIALGSTALIWMALTPSIDQKARQIVDDAFTQAMVVFGTAKALNGVISLAQGTQVGPPGVTVSIGEVLDPINDLVEQFSWVMLASMTSLGIQKILMHLVSNRLFDIMLVTTLVLLNLWLFYRYKNDTRPRNFFFKFTLIVVLLRFSIPVMALANELTYTHVVQQEYNIEALENDIGIIAEKVKQTRPEESSWPSFFSVEEYHQKVEQYTHAVEEASNHIIDLIIAFVFRTIIFPLAFLFLLYQLAIKIVSIRR